MARRYFGLRIAVIAGLFYAVNPWAVLFSRKIWAQELHTPFIILGLLLLLMGFWESRDGGPRARSVFLAQSLGIPLLLVGFQFHFAAWPLLLLVPLALWRRRKQIFARALFVAIVLSVCVIMPYCLGLTQTLESDPTRIADALARSAESGPQFSSASISAILQLVTGSGLEYWLAPNQAAELAAGYLPLLPLTLLLLPLLVVGMHAVYVRCRRFAILLLIWAFLPSLLLLVEWTPVYIHYFIPSIPALALLIGFGLDWHLRLAARKRPLHVVVWLIIALIFALQIQQWFAALDFVERRHVDYPGFTTPLAKLLPLREELSASDDVVVVAGGMSWNLHHEVAVWDTLLWDALNCVRTIVPDGYAVFPSHAFAIVIAPDAPPGPLTDLYGNADPEVFPAREGGGDYMLYAWRTAPSWPGSTIQLIEPQRFDNGVGLTGYSWEDDLITLEWQLPAQQIGADYQFSAQLYDAEGERLDQLDTRFWHGRHWCDGDHLLTFGPLIQHDDARSLKVALYELGSGKDAGRVINADVLDALGNPKGQSVDIPIEQGDA